MKLLAPITPIAPPVAVLLKKRRLFVARVAVSAAMTVQKALSVYLLQKLMMMAISSNTVLMKITLMLVSPTLEKPPAAVLLKKRRLFVAKKVVKPTATVNLAWSV
jgi:hypothetical protein